MKTLHLTILTILSAMVFNSCKDKDDEIINGDVKLTVVEYGSNKPIKNAAVGLLKRSNSSGLGGSSYSIITTANTNENGYVNFGYQKDWSNLYIDVQHPDYYDMSNTSCQQIAKDNYKVVLSGVSYVSVRFFNTYNKDKPETILSYGFDPFRGGGGLPPRITLYDTVYHTFLIPALHKTNVSYSLFENVNAPGPYLRDVLVPFTTAPTSDTVYLTITY
jgi:hypothetical protein